MRIGRPIVFMAVWVALSPIAVGWAPPSLAAEEKMTTVYLVLLKKGPAWTAEQTPDSKAIQEAHMANIRKMWEDHKLIIAGPTESSDGLRGIFIFKVASLEEARALAGTDPAVKAGRLTATVYPWWVEERALPAPGTYCAPPSAK